MKRNLYLLSLGLLACSCSEPMDVVTGRAQIIMKNAPAPVISRDIAKPAPLAAVKPQPVLVEAAPIQAPERNAATPVSPSRRSLAAQNQPVAAAPAPAPKPVIEEPVKPLVLQQPVEVKAAPQPKVKPVVVETKPVVTQSPGTDFLVVKPAPTPKKAVVSQQQPVTTLPAPKPAIEAPAKPVIEKKPVVVATPAPVKPVIEPAPVVTPPSVPAKPVVAQQQPRTTAPATAPQTTQPAKRRYPVMPGQNRGLRR